MGHEETANPLLYEINTRVWLGELSARSGNALSLAEVPEEEIDRIAGRGFDLVWLMGVWRTGEKSAAEARRHPDLGREYRRVLPDLRPADIAGSPYAVADYRVSPGLGGDEALAVLRTRLAKKGLGLVLDFVTNHTGLDHEWVTRHPEFYVQGSAEDLKEEPGDFFEVETVSGEKVLAHGKDPYFPGWTDTAQLNFANPAARAGSLGVLEKLSDQCDGVRCDMAMLALGEVFGRVWGSRALRTAGDRPAEGEFWTEAIEAVRARRRGFLFIAEAYWGLEGRLRELGFDLTYDKTFYDRLRHEAGPSLRAHLEAPPDSQRRAVRFLENHDEPRAAEAFSGDRHRAAAVIAASVPGMLLIHEGQIEGRRTKVPVQLVRRPEEPLDETTRSFYLRLLAALRDSRLRRAAWRLLPVRPAWEANSSFQTFLAFAWQGEGDGLWLAAVNFGPDRGQCYVEGARREWEGMEVDLEDLLGDARYTRDGGELLRKGLYLDLPGHGYHLFRARPRQPVRESPGAPSRSFPDPGSTGTMEPPKGIGRRLMEINTEKNDVFSIVRVKGRVVRENQGDLRKALEEVVSARTKGIALDFQDVDYLDSSGLGCCAAVHKLMNDKKSGSLVMFGASPNILEMWRLIKLDLVIPVLDGEKEALARLKKGTSPSQG